MYMCMKNSNKAEENTWWTRKLTNLFFCCSLTLCAHSVLFYWHRILKHTHTRLLLFNIHAMCIWAHIKWWWQYYTCRSHGIRKLGERERASESMKEKKISHLDKVICFWLFIMIVMRISSHSSLLYKIIWRWWWWGISWSNHSRVSAATVHSVYVHVCVCMFALCLVRFNEISKKDECGALLGIITNAI